MEKDRVIVKEHDKVIALELSKECEALDVSGSLEFKDEIDVIGPVEILNQLFDKPDIKQDSISIAGQLVGQILVLRSWGQVNPLSWLDNEVPELAICYHEDGGVMGRVFFSKTEKDGTPRIFHQGLARLKFVQSECREDGAYWLYKSVGEDELQFCNLKHYLNCAGPSLIHSGRRDSLFSLGNLLYRLGHSLSLSVEPNDRNHCARFLRKCLNFLNKPDHLVVRAYAHEQFARLILNDAAAGSDTSVAPAPLFQTTGNLILSKLAAVHHVSQAIMSLRWARQLQSPEQEDASHDISPSVDLSKCACDDPDCIVVCEIQKCLPTSKVDRKVWNLVQLLSEAYLSLGIAYAENGQLNEALSAVKSACLMPQKFEESCDTSVGVISSSRIFWARAWRFVGDVYWQFYTRRGQEPSDTLLTSTSHLSMPPEVVEEVNRLTKKLTEFSQKCVLCSLVNCSCKSDIASGSSNGIFEYLTGPKTDDTESILLAALNCYEEIRRVFQELPSSLTCGVFKDIAETKGLVFSKLGDYRMSREEMDKAEDAYADALAAYREIGDHTTAIAISCNMGYYRRERAVKTVEEMEALKQSAYLQALKSAKQDYIKSVLFYEEAKKDVDNHSLPKDVVYKSYADTCLLYGRLLEKEKVTASASRYFQKGKDLYASLVQRL